MITIRVSNRLDPYQDRQIWVQTVCINYQQPTKITYRPAQESLVFIAYAQRPPLTLYLIETPFNSFANRADPDQAALLRAA